MTLDTDAPDPTPEPPAARSRRTRRRVVVLAIVVGVMTMAWLLWPSARAPTVVTGGTAEHLVTVTVASPRVGTTAVELGVTRRDGAPAALRSAQVLAVMPAMGHTDLPVRATPLGPGRYRVAELALTMSGQWQLEVIMTEGGAVDRLVVPVIVSG
jgi:YtkA-like